MELQVIRCLEAAWHVSSATDPEPRSYDGNGWWSNDRLVKRGFTRGKIRSVEGWFNIMSLAHLCEESCDC